MSKAPNTKARPTKDEFQKRFTRMYESLSNQIRSGKISPGGFLPSEKQLVSDFQLSRVSVRKVMALLASQKLITKVQGKGNIVGELLPNNKLDQVCMILAKPPFEHFDDYSFPVRPEMRAGFLIGVVERQLIQSGIKVLLMSPDEILKKKLHEQLDFLQSLNVCGIISIYNDASEIVEFNRCAAARGINVLSLSSSGLDCGGVGVVTYDNYSVGRIAAEHLLANRHRVLACIDMLPATQWVKTRIVAFKDICKAMRTDMEISMLEMPGDKHNCMRSSSWYKMGYAAAEKLLAKPRITGVFCINDNVAKGLYDALIEQGRKVPEDISIVGCDNNYDYLSTGLTTISLECHQAGVMAAEIIARQLQGEKSTVWPELRLVKPMLIPRKTVKFLNRQS